MKCKKVCSRLSAYQDGELDLQQSQELERHLENCLTCRSEFAALNRLLDSLRHVTPVTADPGFSSRIMTRLRTRPQAKLHLLPSLAYTLAALAIVVSGFLLEVSTNGQAAVSAQPATTFSAVLSESRNLGLLAVQDSTLDLFGNLKQISLVKKQDNLLSKLPILRSRVNGDGHEN